ncbi:indole-3-glycerol phosphate synthase [Sphingorhabdus lutea]|uniref:Indole-3-glycerol phosphate synthase n=1 Tax=Sphingorhabdus lutea TaxID=1913578 RepID=A0A1L3JBW3_9SPHN|nr:indole-3-glycerol phosphate synthase TrpC [Sphingorhabdus lutea]APG62612.1 indole-3-glycerol phosphate synthase [Sphingorhabdus lutea]
MNIINASNKNSSNKLIEICNFKRGEVAARKAIKSNNFIKESIDQQSKPRGFKASLEKFSAEHFALIAEIKAASPSKGLIRADFNPPAHAIDYEKGGAACLSILTDEQFFKGHDDYLVAARNAVKLPCLRKDFMVDPWQIAESRALGADAILIIMAALDDILAKEIEIAAHELGMDALIEVHDETEAERALTHLNSRLLGVNNRNLATFETDIATCERISKMVPKDYLLVGESGINTHQDLMRLSQSGIKSFLVGESLMRQDDVKVATTMLLTGEKSI